MYKSILFPALLFAGAISFAASAADDNNGQSNLGVIPADAVITQKDKPVKLEQDEKGIFTLILENDIVSGTDSNYTNGFRASWLSPEANQPRAITWVADHLLPGAEDAKANNRVSAAIGQSIFTPHNLKERDIIKNDRPYAGYTYGSIGLVSDTGETLDNAMLTVGIVGPASGAEQTQKFIHSVIGDDIPQGWDHQLKNEAGVELTYERKWRNLYELSPFGAGFDVTPHVGVNLGNVYTNASTGATFRLGYDLPADYGPPRIRPSLPGSDFFIPSKSLGGYLFTAVEGRAVGRNIFLDGNTFSNSHSVDKDIFVGDLQAGVAVTYGDTRVAYTEVFQTKEFKQQKKPEQFGVLSLSVRF